MFLRHFFQKMMWEGSFLFFEQNAVSEPFLEIFYFNSTNKMVASDGNNKLILAMYRRFFSINTESAIKIFYEGG